MSLSTTAPATSTLDREPMPVAPVTLCAWCDAPATRNLDTYHDVACDAHYDRWFAGPDAAPACDCLTCQRTVAPCEHTDATAHRIGTDTVASAWACDACGHLTPYTDADYLFANASVWSPRCPDGIAPLAWTLTHRDARLAHYAPVAR
jgi:hypothetical protein